MSNSLVAQVFTLNVPRPSKIVLLAMAEFADANGNSEASVNQIVIMTGYSGQQVNRVMKSLIIDGLIIPITAGAGEPAAYNIRVKRRYDGNRQNYLTYLCSWHGKHPYNKIKDNE